MKYVDLLCGRNSPHYTQIYTGFHLLERAGEIRIRQRFAGSGVAAIVDGQRLYFDVQDDWSIDPTALASSDAYFKRSYARDLLETTEAMAKVRPLGLNYEVYPDGIDLAAFVRAWRLFESPRSAAGCSWRALKLERAFTPRVSGMQAPPRPRLEPRVIFLTRTWEPDGRSPPKMPSRSEINELRAQCIVALRSEFGSRALAGFAPTPLARARWPDLLAPRSFSKGQYLQVLRDYPICVATTGLHGSIGWKMGEYVAFSKAIVSERLNYSAPAFNADQHYLEFETVAQCVENVGRLFDEPSSREEMMLHNAEYYRIYLRPDQLVGRALGLATLGEAQEI